MWFIQCQILNITFRATTLIAITELPSIHRVEVNTETEGSVITLPASLCTTEQSTHKQRRGKYKCPSKKTSELYILVPVCLRVAEALQFKYF